MGDIEIATDRLRALGARLRQLSQDLTARDGDAGHGTAELAHRDVVRAMEEGPMTRRHGDWPPAGHDDDPVPASQWDVEAVANRMRRRADDAADLKAVLQRLADLDGWRGKAAEAFAERAQDVLGDLGKVEDRYDGAAQALAGRAAREIEDAADIWDDGWWGEFKGWVREHAELVYSVVKVLEIVAAVLGAVLLVLAIVGAAPLALVLLAVTAGVLIVAGQAMLAAADTGKADWGDVGWSLAGLAATLVGGKALTSAARGLKALVPGMAARVGAQSRAVALGRLVGGNRTQFLNAMKIANPRNNLARWVRRLSSAADAEGRAAAQRVDDVLRLQPSRLHAALAQDRQLAQLHASLNRLRAMGPTVEEVVRMNEIQRNLRIALTTNSYGTATWAKGLPGNVKDTWGLVQDPPWSTRPAD